MPDRDKKFHEFAIQSLLFKGRADWYFCFLKAEKIARVLALLAAAADADTQEKLEELSHMAAHLPQEVAHFAAGEADLSFVLADIFSLISATRLGIAQGILNAQNSALLAQEYEQIAQRLQGAGRMSPFVSGDDFAVPEVSLEPQASLPRPLSLSHTSYGANEPIKDISKGHSTQHKGNSPRGTEILAFIKKQGEASIRDIAAVIKDCSEKTIQRELNALIEEGVLKREGERRWSRYIYIGV